MDFAQTIHSAGSDLLELINDILDLSKIEAGRMEVQNESWPIADLAEGLAATFQPLAAEKGLRLRVDVTAGAPATVTADSQRVQQILRNLLSNAVKFTDTGEVHAAGHRGARRARRAGGRLRGRRHRHRHRRGQAGAHLRGLPAGRRHHQPPVRRHRAWACRSAAS